MALTTLPTSWRLAVSAWEFCSAGQAIKTTKNIKPAIARTNATSMIVKPLIPPPIGFGDGLGKVGVGVVVDAGVEADVVNNPLLE